MWGGGGSISASPRACLQSFLKADTGSPPADVANRPSRPVNFPQTHILPLKVVVFLFLPDLKVVVVVF